MRITASYGHMGHMRTQKIFGCTAAGGWVGRQTRADIVARPRRQCPGTSLTATDRRQQLPFERTILKVCFFWSMPLLAGQGCKIVQSKFAVGVVLCRA